MKLIGTGSTQCVAHVTFTVAVSVSKKKLNTFPNISISTCFLYTDVQLSFALLAAL